MTTLGDVWAITALIVGIATCAWSLLLCLALLFPSRSQIAKDAIEARPWKCGITGFLIAALTTALGIGLLSVPFPLVKLVGWVVVLAIMAVSFTGSAGLVLLAAERLREIDGSMSPYGAFSRGAVFVVLPSILPIFGWFLFAPIIFSIGAGAGLKAMWYRQPKIVSPPVVG
jgi:hypothetical protein